MESLEKDYEILKRFVKTGEFTNRRPFTEADFDNPSALIGRKVVPFDMDKRDERQYPHIDPVMIRLEGIELVIEYIPDSERVILTERGAIPNTNSYWYWHPDWLLLVDE